MTNEKQISTSRKVIELLIVLPIALTIGGLAGLAIRIALIGDFEGAIRFGLLVVILVIVLVKTRYFLRRTR
jgi:hypothetical protein